MRHLLLSAAITLIAAFSAFGFDSYPLWPSTPPGDQASDYEDAGGGYYTPTMEYWKPANQTTDICLIVCCGGCYNGIAYEIEGIRPRDFFTSHGVTVVMLRYRTPRRPDVEKHRAAWQDVQRAIRLVRSKADEWNISPNKIGVMGFSAGGHLTLMAATSSLTPAYEPVDELDKIPCNANFAVPIYPAYSLTDGVDNENTNRGDGAELVAEFAFDAQTPPMCFIHGDGDGYSSMASVAAYHKLRTLNIPAEIHVFAKANHAFLNCGPDAGVLKYPQRVLEWFETIGIAERVNMPQRGLCAHRGDQRLAPENTVAAFDAAAKAGAQQVELDLWKTKDGKLVVVHDSSVDRTTNGKGQIHDLTFDEIRALDAGIKSGPEFAGMKVPTFEEVLAVLPRNIWINIHIKTNDGAVEDATRIIRDQNRLHQAFLACGRNECAAARNICPQIKICCMDRGDGTESFIYNAIAERADFIQLCGDYTPEQIQKLKDAGIKINYFGTDDPDKIRQLLKDGVDFPLVNYFTEDWPVAQEVIEKKQ